MMMDGMDDESYDSKMDQYRTLIPVDQHVDHIVYDITLN